MSFQICCRTFGLLCGGVMCIQIYVICMQRPPVSGMILCIEFFRSYGVTPVAICPTWWLRTKDQGIWGSTAWEEQDFRRLMALQEEGLLFASPSGEHDDLYIIDYCYRTDGFLVSNDKYRDHRRERNLDPDWIDARRIGFMFVRDTFLPNPDHIIRLEEFVRQTGKVVGFSTSSQRHYDLLPPPPPTTDLAAMRSEFRTQQHQQHQQQHMMHSASEDTVMAGSTLSQFAGPVSTHNNYANVGSSEEPCDMVDFPKPGLGFLIGKKGARIHEIREESGASVEIQDAVTDASGNIRVVIKGSDVARDRARQAVLEMRDVAYRKLGMGGSRTPPPTNSFVTGSSSEMDSANTIRLAKSDPVGMGYNNVGGFVEGANSDLQCQQQQQQQQQDYHMMDDHHDIDDDL
mmetsp:Transcript_21440/g.38518  ORF Transcript_21440/g.38518 Transcript_21440/m.38518 type:complete len:402 (+) Transcript_21440:550-1755(+)